MRPLLEILGTLALGVWITAPPTPVPDRPQEHPTYMSNSMADLRSPESIGLDNAPSIRILRDPSGLRIQFRGVLWGALSPQGPWSEVVGATSPYPVDPAQAGHRFYRALQPASGGIFEDASILEWSLFGPFQDHFDLAFAGMPDGIFPPRRDKPYFPGSVRVSGHNLPISLRVRGNSSLQECPFPKLKLKIAKDDRLGTPFADAREIDIGSHCAEGGTGTVGRLRDERAVYREALAYDVMREVGFVGPRVRRALIEYHDSSLADPTGESAVGWTLRRQALLMEDAEVVGERLGGRALDDSEIANLKEARFDPALVAGLRLLHALLGNWDYALSETGEGLWNTEVLVQPDGSFIPMAGDFDLASWVTDRVRLNAPHDYRPELPALEREMYFQVEAVRQRTGVVAFDTATTRFREKRAALEQLIRSAAVDDAGRRNIQNHLSTFFTALN